MDRYVAMRVFALCFVTSNRYLNCQLVNILTISTLITGFQLINNQYWKTR